MKKSLKRICSFLLALVLLASLMPAALAESTQAAAEETVPVKVTAVNAVLQKLDSKGNGTGAKQTEMVFDDGIGAFKVTANLPKGKTVSYWIINGVKYVFKTAPKSIIVKKLDYDLTIEAVSKKGEPSTMPTAAEVQAARTGDPLIAETVNATLYLLKTETKGGSTKRTSFDFTQDYYNTAAKKQELGGRMCLKVVAAIPGSKEVDYWLFNKAEFHFSNKVTYFFVHELNASMVYEPVLRKASEYYTVKCSGCTFSGGGYSNATSGKVKYGTTITVTSNYYATDYWIRNGARWQKEKIKYDPFIGKITTKYDAQDKSFTWTVKKNCTFQATQQIN